MASSSREQCEPLGSPSPPFIYSRALPSLSSSPRLSPPSSHPLQGSLPCSHLLQGFPFPPLIHSKSLLSFLSFTQGSSFPHQCSPFPALIYSRALSSLLSSTPRPTLQSVNQLSRWQLEALKSLSGQYY